MHVPYCNLIPPIDPVSRTSPHSLHFSHASQISAAAMAGSSMDQPPLFSAVSSSARQLFQLLKCINFSSKAHVQITDDGIRVSAQESQVMQGWVPGSKHPAVG